MTSKVGNRTLAYAGVRAPTPPNITIHDRDPRTTDYFNFKIGDIWINNGTISAPLRRVWILVDQAGLQVGQVVVPTATWVLFINGGGGPIISLTASDATVSFPLLGNITFPDQVIAGSGTIDSNIQSNVNPNLGPNFTFNLKPVITLPNTSAVGVLPKVGIITFGASDRFISNFGTSNTFIGAGSGNRSLTTANSSAALGSTALASLTTGTGNTGLGYAASINITSGSNNTSVGYIALSSVTTASNNTALGSGALASNTAAENTAVGYQALNINTTGIQNTAVGKSALAANTTANASTAVGYQALHLSTATANTAVGTSTLASATTGNDNTAIGWASTASLTTGANNAALGSNSMTFLTTGSRNLAVGSATFTDGIAAGLITGSNNIGVGHDAGGNYTGAEDSNILIGNAGVVGESNIIRVGTNGGGASQQNKCFIAGIRGITTGVNDAIAVLIDSAHQLGTVSSSARYKQNIQDLADQSEIIYKLRPVLFSYKKSPDVPSWGLIAEEVAEVFPQLAVFNDEGLPETVKYHELVPLLLNEIQKLNNRVKSLEDKLCKNQVS